MWSSLTELAESSHDVAAKQKLFKRHFLDKRGSLCEGSLDARYTRATFDVQKALESGTLLLPRFDHLVNVKLQQTVDELSTVISESGQAKDVLSVSEERRHICENVVKSFA